MAKKKRRARVRKTNTAGWGQRGVSRPQPATVKIPSGRCPYIVESTDPRDLKEWVLNVIEHKHPVITYEKTVFTYWLRHSFDINSEDYSIAKSFIECFLPDSVREKQDVAF